jgi:sporulation protein YlmC with PRC-barrel domain
MKNPTKLLMVAGLMCGTAAPAALAQEADQNAAVQACQRLALIVQDYEDRFREEWIDRANDVISSDGRLECAQYVAQAEQAIDELERRDRMAQQQGQGGQLQTGTGQTAVDQAGTAANQNRQMDAAQADTDVDGGRIVVSQPEPRVLVEQDAPEITYSQDPAQARVEQAAPQIIVRQAEPTVRVQMPRPQITITQAEPEIIVRLPEPNVTVDVPEPRFNVSQSQPEVRVNQPEPQVSVQMEQPEVNVQDQDQAEVQVERGQAVVRREGAEQQARVQIERAQPQVRYERAEPNIEFEMEGEPQVTYNRTGEPNVRVERIGDQAADQQARPDGQPQPNQQAMQDQQDDDRTASIQQDPMPEQAYDALRGDAQMQGAATTIRVSDLVDRQVVNARGEQLGQVERVVANGNRTYLILSEGGFLGMGEREVALPLDRVSSIRGDEQLVLQGLSEEDLEAMPRWNAGSSQELGENDEVDIFES